MTKALAGDFEESSFCVPSCRKLCEPEPSRAVEACAVPSGLEIQNGTLYQRLSCHWILLLCLSGLEGWRRLRSSIRFRMSAAPSGLRDLGHIRQPRAYAAGLCFFRPFGPGLEQRQQTTTKTDSKTRPDSLTNLALSFTACTTEDSHHSLQPSSRCRSHYCCWLSPGGLLRSPLPPLAPQQPSPVQNQL